MKFMIVSFFSLLQLCNAGAMALVNTANATMGDFITGSYPIHAPKKDTGRGMLFVSESSFPYAGTVAEVQVFAFYEDPTFQISAWRPYQDGSLMYDRVGSAIVPLEQGLNKIDLPAAKVFDVQKGDMLGWYSKDVQPVEFKEGGSITVRRAYGYDDATSTVSMGKHPDGWKRTYSIQVRVQSPHQIGQKDGVDMPYYMEASTCYKIEKMILHLPHKPPKEAPLRKMDASVGPDSCYEFCKKYQTLYIGLKDDLCYCFDQYQGERVDAAECNIACVGDPSAKCGGSGDLYSMHLLFAWVPKPKILKCAAPLDIEGSSQICNIGSDKLAERMCEVQCVHGYQLTENSLICDTTVGKWMGHAQCQEIRCGMPPKIANAQTTCMHSSAAGEGKCNVDCDAGSQLTVNTLRCNVVSDHPTSIGFYEGEAVCKPKSCGIPPKQPNALSIHAEVFYPHQVRYTCEKGYTLNGKVTGVTSFFSECRVDGTFTAIPERTKCKPVACGTAPTVAHGDRVPGADGKLLDFLHYPERAKFRCKEGYSVDGFGQVKELDVGCEHNALFSHVLECKPTLCGIAVSLSRATTLTNDRARMIVYQETVKYQCDKGYQLADGQMEFMSMCADTGILSNQRGCVPVSCGVPPVVAHASVTSGEIVFPQRVTYSCDVGHTIDGDPHGADFFTVICQAHKQFSVPGKCQPVHCDKPSLAKASWVDVFDIPKTGVIYGMVLDYSCDEGYSLDKTSLPGASAGSTQCLANGEFSKVEPCSDINDCAGHSCGPFGSCVDHFMNYTCNCRDGFEQRFEDGELICGNVDDCGSMQCGDGGECVDLVNDYTCECNKGFELFEGEAAAGSGSESHWAVGGCPWAGEARNQIKASTEIAAVRCCSQDGQSCQSEELGCKNGTVAEAKSICESKGLRLCSKVELQSNVCCDSGCNFDVKTTWTGTPSQMPQKFCRRVECGAPPEVANAVAPLAKSVFGDVVQYTCVPGYSITGEGSGTNIFAIECLANGEFTTVKDCKNVTCGTPPLVVNAEVESSEVKFPGVAVYRCNEGYTIDGHPDGTPTFETKCSTSGNFLERLSCQRVTCGPPPLVEMAHVDSQPLLYQDMAAYTCTKGYSTDPDDPDKQTFSATCDVQGRVRLRQRCYPVKCKLPELPTGLLAEYFFFIQGDSVPQFLERHPDLSRVETNFNIAPTDLPWQGVRERDHFAVRWTGQILINTPGLYEFAIDSDDGSFLYLDGTLSVQGASQLGGSFMNLGRARHIGGHRLRVGPSSRGVVLLSQALQRVPPINPGVKIISNDGIHAMQRKEGSRQLGTGPHEVYMEFFERDRFAGFQWYYKGSDTGGKWIIVPDHVLEPPEVTYAGPPTVVGRGNDVQLLFFPQIVSFACKHGYTVDGDPTSTNEISAACNSRGVLEGVKQCVPVMCDKSNIPALDNVKSSQIPADIQFGDVLKFECEEGFAVETTLTDKLLLVDTGDLTTTFGLECLASGAFSAARACKNIDDCYGHTCGPHGTCVDGINNYTCSCQDGYEETVRDGETFCGNVNDCGPGACGSFGVCHDLVSIYRCECFAGYEPKQVNESDIICEPKSCGEVSVLENTGMQMPVSLKYPESLSVECQEGYSIDGSTVTEAMAFRVECTTDGSLTSAIGCKPVECGFAPSVFQISAGPPATKKFTFGETARYECAPGHTIDGSKQSRNFFELVCGADGRFPPAMDCQPVSCGTPPRIAFGTVSANAVAFPGRAVYTCDSGFTLSSRSPEIVNFQRKCWEDGEYEAVPAGLLENHCHAGVIPSEGDHVSVELETCDIQYGGTNTGHKISFKVNGAWVGKTALPASIDRHQTVDVDVTLNGWPTELKIEASGANAWCYRRISIVHCNWEFKVLDAPVALAYGNNPHWVKDEAGAEAQKSQIFSVPPKLSSATIDFSQSSVSTDNLGGGGPDTGDAEIRYSNVGTTADGKQVDLVLTAPHHAPGIINHGAKKNGTFGQINMNAGKSMIIEFTFQESDTKKEVILDQFELSFFDLDRSADATEVLYSTDFEQFFTGAGFEYDIAPLDDGWTAFSATHRGNPCHETQDPENLGEVTCEGLTVDRLKHSVMLRFRKASSAKIGFKIRCDRGSCVGSHSFLFSGKSNAILTSSSEVASLECSRVSCGRPPEVSNAFSSALGRRKFGQLVTYDCAPGYTVDGTPQSVTDFSIQCQADGTYTPLTSVACVLVAYRVQGRINDATNMHKISGATIKLIKDGETLATVTSNSRGLYDTPAVPVGNVIIGVSRDGFITAHQSLLVEGEISAGGFADVSISPLLPADGWRAVLTWGEKPRDLDSHVYFLGSSCRMYYGRKNVRCSSFNYVQAILDVDDVSSYGPETTTFLNLRKCHGRRSCRLVFKVHNYSQRPGWEVSEAVVKVYNGDHEYATYKIGVDGVTSGAAGSSNQYWSVFALDGLTGEVHKCTTADCDS